MDNVLLLIAYPLLLLWLVPKIYKYIVNATSIEGDTTSLKKQKKMKNLLLVFMAFMVIILAWVLGACAGTFIPIDSELKEPLGVFVMLVILIAGSIILFWLFNEDEDSDHDLIDHLINRKNPPPNI